MQVREVICPSCSHRFMWMDVEEGPTIKKYRSVETGETFHTANPVGRATWRGFWLDTGENSTGRKFCDNLTNG